MKNSIILNGLLLLLLGSCADNPSQPPRELIAASVEQLQKNWMTPCAVGYILESSNYENDVLTLDFSMNNQLEDFWKEGDSTHWAAAKQMSAYTFLQPFSSRHTVEELEQLHLSLRLRFFNHESIVQEEDSLSPTQLVDYYRQLNDTCAPPLFNKDFYVNYLPDQQLSLIPQYLSDNIFLNEMQAMPDGWLLQYIVCTNATTGMDASHVRELKDRLLKQLCTCFENNEFLLRDLVKHQLVWSYRLSTYTNHEQLCTFHIASSEILKKMNERKSLTF